MAEKLLFELVSPKKLLLSEQVGMVVVPGGEGNFGVLPGHALFISTVRPGVIDVYEDKIVSERIFVSGGFAEVTPERCTVLADEALPISAFDRVAVEGDIKSAEAVVAAARDQGNRLSGAERDVALVELAVAERLLAVARAKLEALGVTTQ